MSDSQTQIDQLVKANDIVLFMKGNASFPMCGFSGRAIQILKACGVDPKTVRRERPPHHGAIRDAMKDVAGKRRRFGYRRIGVLLERKGTRS